MSRRGARIFVRGGQDDGGTKGPERGAKRQSAGRGVAVALPSMGVWGYAKFSKNQRWNCTFSFGFINVWRVTPVAKQSSVCNSGANFFSIHDGGDIHPCPPSGYAPVYEENLPQWTAEVCKLGHGIWKKLAADESAVPNDTIHSVSSPCVCLH